MLGVFKAKVNNERFASFASEDDRLSGIDVLQQFKHLNRDSTTVEIDRENMMAYSHKREALLPPRQFAAVDDVFCIFSGNLHNLAQLRNIYGLPKNVTEAQLVINMYKVLRDRAPYPIDLVLRDLEGSFVFALFDRLCNHVFVASDSMFKVPFYWGLCKDGAVAFSDSSELIKKCCKSTFSAFPKGCFFSSKDGLYSYEIPLKKLSSIPHVNSRGELCAY